MSFMCYALIELARINLTSWIQWVLPCKQTTKQFVTPATCHYLPTIVMPYYNRYCRKQYKIYSKVFNKSEMYYHHFKILKTFFKHNKLFLPVESPEVAGDTSLCSTSVIDMVILINAHLLFNDHVHEWVEVQKWITTSCSLRSYDRRRIVDRDLACTKFKSRLFCFFF